MLVGAIEVTTTHPDAADDDLAGNPDRLESPPGIGDVHPHVRQGSAHRDGVSRGQPRDVGAARGLGGAVAVPDRAAPLQQRLGQPVGERFAAGRRLETTVATPAGGDESPPGCRRRKHVGRTAQAINRLSAAGFAACSAVASTRRAPHASAEKMSKSAMSKLMDATDSTVSQAPMPNSLDRAASGS